MSTHRRVRRARKLPPGAEEDGTSGLASSVESVGRDAGGGERGQSAGVADGKPVPRVRISTERGDGEDKLSDRDSRGAGKPITPRSNSPTRGKPPVTPNGDANNEDERDAVDRSRGRVLDQSIYNNILNSWLLNTVATGYRLGPQSRGAKADNIALGPGDKNRFLQLSVTTLQMDTTNFVRPAVRMHVVYKDSGMYVKSAKIPPAAPMTTMYSTVTDKTHVVWDEDLVLKAHLKDVVSEDVVILFEVLDDRPSLKATSGSAGARKMKRLGWSFLLPTDQNGAVNVGLTESGGKKQSDSPRRSPRGGAAAAGDNKNNQEGGGGEPFAKKRLSILQVFESVDFDGLVGSMQRQAMGWPAVHIATDKDEDAHASDSIPSVYLQWRMREYVPVPHSCMYITSVPCDGIKTPIGSAMRIPEAGQSPEMLMKAGGVVVAEDAKGDSKSEAAKLNQKAKSSAIKRLRGRNEPCVVPDKLLHRLVVGPEGATALRYNHAGNLLAVAAKTGLPPLHAMGSQLTGNVYSIILYDADRGTEVWREDTAHHGVIYDLTFSSDDSFLASCSGDGTVKTWSIGDHHSPNPYLLQNMATSPPVFIYSVVFKEFRDNSSSGTMNTNTNEAGDIISTKTACPPVITGSSDGCLRQWANGKLEGYISVDESDDHNNAGAPVAHANARIHTVTIDRRSRYLLTGDSAGEILVWRLDQKGWYQLLRRFKQDSPGLSSGATNDPLVRSLPTSGGVNSLSMHPDASKAQVLVMSQEPATLRVFSTSSYRAVSQCSGFGGSTSASSKTIGDKKEPGSCFGRAALSPDGSYAVACTNAEAGSSAEPYYRLKVWEAQMGHSRPTALSDIVLPFPAKDICWHPSQHALAVACQGPGAVVTVFVGERESAEIAVSRIQADAHNDDLSMSLGASLTGGPKVEK